MGLEQWIVLSKEKLEYFDHESTDENISDIYFCKEFLLHKFIINGEDIEEFKLYDITNHISEILLHCDEDIVKEFTEKRNDKYKYIYYYFYTY